MGLTYPLIPKLGNCSFSPVRYLSSSHSDFPLETLFSVSFTNLNKFHEINLWGLLYPVNVTPLYACLFLCMDTSLISYDVKFKCFFSSNNNWTNSWTKRFICNINHYTIYMKHLCVLFKYARTLNKHLTHIVSTKTSHKNILFLITITNFTTAFFLTFFTQDDTFATSEYIYHLHGSLGPPHKSEIVSMIATYFSCTRTDF